MTLWNDRQGRFSPIKAATLALAVAPAVVITYWFVTGALQPLSVKNALHLIGDWAVRFLVLTMALTPLQRVFNYTKFSLVRRMLGVTSFAYAITHFILYIVNIKFDAALLLSEITHRFYLAIGFVALLGLCALAATSFDSAVRKMGAKWKTLHRLVYAITILALFHYFLQSKLDVSPATLLAGLFILAMTVRVMIARRFALTPAKLAAGAFVATALTALTEFSWYGLATGVKPIKIFMANFMIGHGLRPAVIILITGLGISALAYMRQRQSPIRQSVRQ
jgi:methionine sulfoxide reductase heme-binding subunit